MQDNTIKLLAMTLASCSLAACVGDDSDDDKKATATPAPIVAEKPFTAVTLDASNSNQYTYYDLQHGAVVDADDEWHIAFKRYNVKLGGNVKGAIGDAQEDYYASGTPIANAFSNATAELEEQSLFDVLSADALVFESSDTVPYIKSSDWYVYDFTTHVISANNDNYWMLKSAEGNSYAKFHISDITAYNVTFDFYTQQADETAYSSTVDASFAVSMTTPGNTCFDFDSNAVVDCASSAAWDIQIQIASRKYITVLNGGNSGTGAAAAYGPIDRAELDSYAGSADLVAQAYGTDQPGGVFNSYPWQEYAVTGLAGDHGIWPNYRVYVIDTDTADTTDELIKLQVTNYYNAAGASGHISLRYMSLSDDGQ